MQAMLVRVGDKIPVIRVQAINALGRLQVRASSVSLSISGPLFAFILYYPSPLHADTFPLLFLIFVALPTCNGVNPSPPPSLSLSLLSLPNPIPIKDPSNAECPVITEYMQRLSSDSSADVRRAALSQVTQGNDEGCYWRKIGFREIIPHGRTNDIQSF